MGGMTWFFPKPKNVTDYPAKFTWYSFGCCFAATMGGLLFGYDLGVAGGVSAMPAFSRKFFPSVYEAMYGDATHKFNQVSPWCASDNQVLAAFNSCIYLSAMFAALAGSQLAHTYGRRKNMIAAGLCYLIGAGLNAGAVHISMLIIGRLMLGCGIGLANSSVTIYANEMSPARLRGCMNLFFQLSTCIGIMLAQLLNWGIEATEWGWRLSVGMAAVPAVVIFISGMVLPESPTSLIQLGHITEGRRVLQKVRGNVNIEAEYDAILRETREAATTKWPLMKIVRLEQCYVPHVVTSLVITAGQQLTGINSILFYAPQIFSTIGSGRSGALLNTVIIGSVLAGGTFIAMAFVDKFGRRFFYVYCGLVMGFTEMLCGGLINHYFQTDNDKLTPEHAKAILAIICIYVGHYAFSYGPLGWLVPSEIQPAEIRTAGMSVATACNMLFTFFIGQAFLKMMCSLKSGVFYFFASFCVLQAIYYYFMLPETKGHHVEEVHAAFHEHWFWGRFPEVPRSEDAEDPRLGHVARKVAAADTNNGTTEQTVTNGNVTNVTPTNGIPAVRAPAKDADSTDDVAYEASSDESDVRVV